MSNMREKLLQFLDTQTVQHIPRAVISPLSLIHVKQWLKAHNIDLPDTCLKTIGYKWLTERGTFPKRLALWCLKNGKGIVDTSPIGNMVREDMSLQQEKFIFDITDKFTWGKSDFGQCNSCWWTHTRPPYKQLWQDAGHLCLRFFQLDNKGYGRSWIWVDPDDEFIILMNFYGEKSGLQARILAAALHMEYKPIGFWCYGVHNNGGAYVVASKENMIKRKQHMKVDLIRKLEEWN
jgi:hypothetical protein